jgi:hypothetical protein
MPGAQFSSDDFAISRFPLHGQTAIEVRGAVLRAVVRGPFNLELVQAQCRLLSAAGLSLPADRRYLELIEYQQSLLMPAEAWTTMAAFIEQGVEHGFCALGTVLVLAPDVEGEALFRERAARLWSRSRPVFVCSTREAGEAQLEALLRQHGLDAAPTAPIAAQT